MRKLRGKMGDSPNSTIARQAVEDFPPAAQVFQLVAAIPIGSACYNAPTPKRVENNLNGRYHMAPHPLLQRACIHAEGECDFR